MGIHRVRIAKDKAEFIKNLVIAHHSTGSFETYADAVVFAAALGANRKKRIPIGTASKEPAPIALEVFASRGYDLVIKLIAIASTHDPTILAAYDETAEARRLQIFEEYANGGLEILRHELRGSIDSTERLLLMLSLERHKPEPTDEEFDLTKFLDF